MARIWTITLFFLVVGVSAPTVGVLSSSEYSASADLVNPTKSPVPSIDDEKETPTPRLVDGEPVPPFGSPMESGLGSPFARSSGLLPSHRKAWPERRDASGDALVYGEWTRGPYKNPAGERWVKQINAWYREGDAAGLTQDTFRSFDKGHSSIQEAAYPQMSFEKSVPDLGPPWENIFEPRVTMGVQSYGLKGESMIEARSRAVLRLFHEPGKNVPPFQSFYRLFYENNFLYIAPAVHSYSQENDAFAFLSPFYLHSIGASGTDSKLMRPLVFASAALPPDLKTRILRTGVFVPTMMYLFKSHVTGGIESPDAHVPAYDLPEEAADGFEGPSPFLDGLMNSAHTLTHIPPVCRLLIRDFQIEAEGDHSYGDNAYYENNTYAFAGALRPDQTFVLTIDLRFSWTDQNLPIVAYKVLILRGDATVEPLNQEHSVVKIRIPCMLTNKRNNLRTDVLLLVNDGTYYSAPAYVSVRHLDRLDPITLGIKRSSPLTDPAS
jgi:hypothetical protein